MGGQLEPGSDPLLAPCGLCCRYCAVRQAHLAGDRAMQEKLAAFFKVKPREVACQGCMSQERLFFCQSCGIRECAVGKELTGRHECAEFPGRLIEDFPVPAGRAIMLEAVPRWREVGTRAWLQEERARHTCPECGTLMVRGMRRCPTCNGKESS